jgi:chromosome segregation ATPase
MSANINYLKVDLIRIDGGTQSRAHLNQNVINEYADLFSSSKDILPPIKVFFDGQDYWNADGFHRLAAAKQANLETISAIIEQGTRRDAILFSVGANAEHGLRRTDDDKRRAVNTLLTDDEWLNWSDNQIAKKCKVSQPFVSKLRKELNHASTVNVDSKEKRTYERNGKTHTMHTDKIGKSQPTQNNQEPDKDPNTKEIFESNQFKEDVKQELENSHPELAERFDQDVELPSYNVISEQEKPIELNELNIELYSEQQEIEDLKNQKSALNEEIASLRFQKGQLEKQLEKANQKISNLELGITAKNEVIKKNYEQIDHLTKTNSRHSLENESITRSIRVIDQKITDSNNQLILSQNHVIQLKEENENLTKELKEANQKVAALENELNDVGFINNNTIELEKNNKNLEDRIYTLIKENETLKEANGRLKLVVKPSNSNQSDEMLVKIQSIFEASLEKGKEKREGVRIGRKDSTELLNNIKQTLGVE